ncbi:hypothetical protein ATK36_5442 [Amycolatopsis sulphurea]|uniref:DUF6292 domain-containing protein n=1 Tax=Amycolatopsis sulphurea TaxID=76022 RepID=A0A2A9FIH5_9PSEU|nr:DUF6292 family protein [Amycolatopsis sulphurea]PFG50229.1 hypothetical protein ATK36_5442 [Amycolatopsis sulphurea]
MLRSGPERPRSLPAADDPHSLRRELVAYVREVAAAVGVSAECASCEVSDTVTAYVALNGRAPEFPGQDLMLLWNARQGWAVSVETAPGEPAVLVARLDGDVTPEPDLVRRFVAALLTTPHDADSRIPPQPVRDHGEPRRRRLA